MNKITKTVEVPSKTQEVIIYSCGVPNCRYTSDDEDSAAGHEWAKHKELFYSSTTKLLGIQWYYVSTKAQLCRLQEHLRLGIEPSRFHPQWFCIGQQAESKIADLLYSYVDSYLYSDLGGYLVPEAEFSKYLQTAQHEIVNRITDLSKADNQIKKIMSLNMPSEDASLRRAPSIQSD